MQKNFSFATRDFVIVQEARKRFDKASLLYDQVRFTFLVFINFLVTVDIILLLSRVNLFSLFEWNRLCLRQMVLFENNLLLLYHPEIWQYFPFIGSLF